MNTRNAPSDVSPGCVATNAAIAACTLGTCAIAVSTADALSNTFVSCFIAPPFWFCGFAGSLAAFEGRHNAGPEIVCTQAERGFSSLGGAYGHIFAADFFRRCALP